MNRVLPKRDDKQFESTRGRCTTHALVDMLCMWHIALLDQSQRARVCSRVRPDVRDRQTSDRLTDVRQKHRLMPPAYGGGSIIKYL